MNNNRNRNKARLIKIIVALLLLTTGSVFAAALNGTVVPVETPAAVSPAFQEGIRKLSAIIDLLTASNRAADQTQISNRTMLAQANIDDRAGPGIDRHVIIGSQDFNMPGDAAASAELDMKLNNAAIQLYAAADDLANALTVAVFEKYQHLNHEQRIALWIDEGRRYGYVAPDPLNLSSKDSFSLISKALAQSSGNNKGYTRGAPTKGQRGKIEGLQQRANFSGPPKSQASGAVQGAIWASMEAPIVGKTPGNTECGKGNMNIDCPGRTVEEVVAEMEVQPGVKKTAQAIAWNSVPSGTGVGFNMRGTDFFISSAYAQSDEGSYIDLMGAVNNLAEKSTQFCQAAQQSKVDKLAGCGNDMQADNSDHSGFFIKSAHAQAGGMTSALWAMHAVDCSRAASQPYQEEKLKSSASKSQDMANSIQEGAKSCANVWTPDYQMN